MRGVAFSIGAAVMGCASLWHATDGMRAITSETARRVAVADQPRTVPPFIVETMTGALVAPTQGPALIEFIYTSCPTICQTSAADFATLRDHLVKNDLSVPMYSISFDPQRDDLTAMLNYAQHHDATGNPWTIGRPLAQDLDRVLSSFDVTVIADRWGGFEHNIAVLLIDAHGRFAGAYDTDAFLQIAAAVRAEL